MSLKHRRGFFALTSTAVLALSLLGAPLAATAKLDTTVEAEAAPQLSPDPAYTKVLQRVLKHLDRFHYQHLNVDDKLSERVLKQYLDDLDRGRASFSQQDIVRFQTFRHQLDEALDEGDAGPAFVIFNRYLERQEQRLLFTLKYLKSVSKNTDFEKPETLLIDRSKQPWPADDAELESLWRRLAKNELLNRMLAGDTLDKALETVTTRYQRQLHRLHQTKAVDAFELFVNSFARSYDPHTRYMPARESENFDIQMSLSLEGIGAMLESDGENTKIVSLVPGGPAEKSGLLKAADKIVGVGQNADGKVVNVVGMRLDDVVDLIRGPKDSVVQLEIVRSMAGEEQPPRVVQITRNTINLEEQRAHSKVLDIQRDGRKYHLGVIEISRFYHDFDAMRAGDANFRSVSRDVRDLVEKLQEEDEIDGLIIDLRNNSGGSLEEVNRLVGMFIRTGPTVQVRGSDSRVRSLRDNDPQLIYTGPMAVMVNRLSASASEIFAGAMQDYERAIVIGGQTFGKGTVQTLTPLQDGRLKYTQAKFYRISGESTQNRGVLPDIDYPVALDTQLIGESALEDALPWDTIPPARYTRQGHIHNLIPELQKLHSQRAANDPEFIYLEDQAKFRKTRGEQKTLSLQESERRRERAESQQERLALENRLRKALGKEPYADFTSFEDAKEEPEELDAQTREAGQILLDYIALNQRRLAQRP